MLLYGAYLLLVRRQTATLERARADACALFLGVAVVLLLGFLGSGLH